MAFNERHGMDYIARKGDVVRCHDKVWVVDRISEWICRLKAMNAQHVRIVRRSGNVDEFEVAQWGVLEISPHGIQKEDIIQFAPRVTRKDIEGLVRQCLEAPQGGAGNEAIVTVAT